MSTELVRYRQSLLTAMGLAPAMAGLALAGCDAQADTLGQVAPPSVLLGITAPTPVLTGTWNTITVNNLYPNQPVGLAVGTGIGSGPCPTPVGSQCLDIVGARALGYKRANASGEAVFQVLVPSATPDGATYYLQSAAYGIAPTVSAPLEITTDHAPRSCGELPFPTRDNGYSFNEYLICGPIPDTGMCAPYGDIDSYTLTQAFWAYTGTSPWTDTGPATCFEDTIADRCCYAAEVYTIAIGRPFTVRGDVRVAARAQDPSWSSTIDLDVSSLPRRVRRRLADLWTATAHGEHASIASFARFQLQLMQLGAPADLVADATVAMADEILHARDAFAVASALAGEPVGPGPLDTEGASEAVDARSILLDCVREGCIAETIAAAQVTAAAERCADPKLRTMLIQVAEDESRHAALAWRFVRWMLTQHPELADDVRAMTESGFVLPPTQPDPDAAYLLAFGHLPRHEADTLAAEVMAQVVRPCARAMLGDATPSTDPLTQMVAEA